MSELEFIADQIKRSFDGEAWHGPGLMEVLDGTDAKTATARSIPGAHSIWELVLHITGWERVMIRRIVERKVATLSDSENFGQIVTTDESAWQAAMKNLRSTHDELVRLVSNLDEARLNEQVPGKDYDIRFMLHGAPQHAAYHGGQI